MPHKRRFPKPYAHPSGQDRIRLDGKDVYLGKTGSIEAKQEYDRRKLEWQIAQSGGQTVYLFQVIELNVIEHGYLRGAKLTNRGYVVRKALEQAGLATRVPSELRPADLENFLDTLAAQVIEETDREGNVVSRRPRYTRGTCNEMGRILRGVVKWGERKGHVPVGTLHRLDAAEFLRRGRSPARESKRVQPVSDETLEATLPHLPPVVADLARFQRLTGCRPDEACRLRLADTTVEIVRVGGRDLRVRLWRLEQHKTAHHGKERAIWIGPKALLVITRNANGDEDAPVFRTPAGAAYRRDSYAYAIRRACVREGIERWSPNQLRHARATELNKSVGLDIAGAVLGHERLDTTQIYAQKQMEASMQAAALTG